MIARGGTLGGVNHALQKKECVMARGGTLGGVNHALLQKDKE